LILGSVGSAAFLVGLVGVMVVAMSRVCYSDSSYYTECPEYSYTPWLLTMLAGAGAATTGWIMFGGSSTKVRAETYAAMPRVSFGAAPTRNGGAAALTIAF
jgi:hypothetical protein